MIPFMRAGARRGISRLIGITPSQAGKSNGIFNIAGSRLADAPVPMLYIAPTKSQVMAHVEPKIDQMLRDCPELWDVTLKGKKYTRVTKRVNGVPLRLAWGGSTSEMKGDTAAIVFVDELDEFDVDINNQGGALELADARHASYDDGLTVATSTPTEGNIDTCTHEITGLVHWQPASVEAVLSQIWRAWQGGTRHEWAWPCPLCMHYFVPRFSLLKFDSKASQAELELNAHVQCPHCEGSIVNRHKSWMNERGVFIAPGQYVYPYEDGAHSVRMVDAAALGEIPEPDHDDVFDLDFGEFAMPSEVATTDVSMWTSGLAHYSLSRTFGAIAWLFLRAARSGEPSNVKGVVNTVLGECFRFGGEAPEYEAVAARKTGYLLGQVPAEVTQVFVTADVQNDRVVYVVRGWGADGQSWLLDAEELWGDTQEPATLRQLDLLLTKTYDGIPVRACAIDSGFRTLQVYDYCRTHLGLAVPTKGHDQMDRPFYASNVDVRPDGKVVKYSVQLWHINTDTAKSWVHSRMVVTDPAAGAWWLPGDVSDYYLRQIVAEQRMAKPSGKVSWHKLGRNDMLDCEALQWFLFRCLGPVAQRTAPMAPPQQGSRQLSRGIDV